MAKAAKKPGKPAPRDAEKKPTPAARARRDRGADTRAQLIDAALDAFGRAGFEGASTRDIAKAANANLAAILYHFGGKEGLHLAVAEHIAQSIGAKLGPTIAAIGSPAATATPAAARAMLHTLVETFADVILGTAEAERWARFIVREQMQPTAAFDIIFRIMGGAAGVASRLLATALGQPEDDEIKLRVLALFGQVLVFRVAQALVLRRMGWTEIGQTERAEIKRIVIGHINAILDGAAP
jgi:AcrR family transcriptional regulator